MRCLLSIKKQRKKEEKYLVIVVIIEMYTNETDVEVTACCIVHMFHFNAKNIWNAAIKSLTCDFDDRLIKTQ